MLTGNSRIQHYKNFTSLSLLSHPGLESLPLCDKALSLLIGPQPKAHATPRPEVGASFQGPWRMEEMTSYRVSRPVEDSCSTNRCCRTRHCFGVHHMCISAGLSRHRQPTPRQVNGTVYRVGLGFKRCRALLEQALDNGSKRGMGDSGWAFACLGETSPPGTLCRRWVIMTPHPLANRRRRDPGPRPRFTVRGTRPSGRRYFWTGLDSLWLGVWRA